MHVQYDICDPQSSCHVLSNAKGVLHGPITVYRLVTGLERPSTSGSSHYEPRGPAGSTSELGSVALHNQLQARSGRAGKQILFGVAVGVLLA